MRVAVDADGEALKEALKEGPDLIKPNRQEFCRLTGLEPATPEQCAGACRALMARTGVGAVCLSLGGDGAVFADRTGALYAPAVKTEVLSLHGAGDSMLAALCLSLLAGENAASALRYAAAAAAATVSLPGTDMADEALVRAFLDRACVRELD